MFNHKMFDKYDYNEVPLEEDLYIVDEVYLKAYEKVMLSLFEGGEYKNVGYVSYVAARNIQDNFIELSWYPNVFDRFHEVSISLPKNQFVCCVGCWRYSEKPRIFVRSEWLENIHLRSYSVFALIDAIGVRKALEKNEITREKLVELRSGIDSIAEKYPDISFISFADSLLLKSNWSVGYFKKNIKYTYEPEIFIHLANEINFLYQATLGLSTYSIVTQGGNEYYDDTLLHISESKNHISLNSFGIPFAQLMEIENAVRNAIKTGVHPPSELYLDMRYHNSLKYKYEFDKKALPSNEYQSKMIGTASKYFCSTRNDILSNLSE